MLSRVLPLGLSRYAQPTMRRRRRRARATSPWPGRGWAPWRISTTSSVVKSGSPTGDDVARVDDGQDRRHVVEGGPADAPAGGKVSWSRVARSCLLIHRSVEPNSAASRRPRPSSRTRSARSAAVSVVVRLTTDPVGHRLGVVVAAQQRHPGRERRLPAERDRLLLAVRSRDQRLDRASGRRPVTAISIAPVRCSCSRCTSDRGLPARPAVGHAACARAAAKIGMAADVGRGHHPLGQRRPDGRPRARCRGARRPTGRTRPAARRPPSAGPILRAASQPARTASGAITPSAAATVSGRASSPSTPPRPAT